MKFPKSGLYVITQTEQRTDAEIISAVTAALNGGAAVVQHRDKSGQDNQGLSQELLNICHSYNRPFIINDNIDLAEKLGADGVHLGKYDSNLAQARQRLGADAIIGISCYNSLETAISMQAHGADYVAFGRFYPSTTKPLAAPADLSTLTLAKQTLKIPIVAIGGILPSNALTLLDAGADLLAVIAGVFDSPNPEQAARDYVKLISDGF